MKFLWTCQEVTRWMASGAPETASFATRLRVGLHYRLCRCCADYAKALKNVSILFRTQFAPLPPAEIQKSTQAILQVLLKKAP